MTREGLDCIIENNIDNIYLDFDETCVDSIDSVLIQLNRRFNTNFTMYDVKKWNMSDCFPNLTSIEVEEIFDSVEFFDNLKWKDGTIDFIDWYGKEYCNIVLIKCDDEIRRERAKLRGGYEEEEFNRRLEDDKRVFSVDNMLGLIDYTIENNSTLEDLQLKCKVLVDKLINV